jgi:hypothetical protein
MLTTATRPQSALARANLHGLAAHTGRSDAEVSVYLRLPENCSLAAAQDLVADWVR